MCVISIVNEEIKLIKLKMENPKFFLKNDVRPISPLYWASDHPKIWLIEILCALEQVGSIVTSDGTKASFTLIMRCFEEFLNVKLGEPQSMKRAVFIRKIDLTKYMDKLRNALIEYSKNV